MKHLTDVLFEFLNYPLSSGDLILEKFKSINSAINRRGNEPKQEFVYIKGNREDRVLLVAHVDTVWDFTNIGIEELYPEIIEQDGVISSANENFGIGADDRAGCALLWLLKDLGHSLLLVDGEEKREINGKTLSCIGSNWIMNDPKNTDIREDIQNHQFMIQFDRQQGNQFKCYTVATEEFRNYVIEKTGYYEPDRERSTDIKILARDICGVNLSVGYYNEHTPQEKIVIKEWLNTLKIVQNWLEEPFLPKYELNINKSINL